MQWSESADSIHLLQHRVVRVAPSNDDRLRMSAPVHDAVRHKRDLGRLGVLVDFREDETEHCGVSAGQNGRNAPLSYASSGSR